MGECPAWATRARFNARLVEREGVLVRITRDSSGDVACALFDTRMSHLDYLETREDSRRRGVASQLWARVREGALHTEITATPNTEDGKCRPAAGGFVEADGIRTWRRSR